MFRQIAATTALALTLSAPAYASGGSPVAPPKAPIFVPIHTNSGGGNPVPKFQVPIHTDGSGGNPVPKFQVPIHTDGSGANPVPKFQVPIHTDGGSNPIAPKSVIQVPVHAADSRGSSGGPVQTESGGVAVPTSKNPFFRNLLNGFTQHLQIYGSGKSVGAVISL